MFHEHNPRGRKSKSYIRIINAESALSANVQRGRFTILEVNCLKQTSQQNNLIFRLFLYIPVVWAALLIAQSLGGGLPDLLSNLTAALKHPFLIQWTDKSLLSILHRDL